MGLPIELINIDLFDTVIGKHLDQSKDALLYQVDTGGFQWLHKATGQSYRYAVLVPLFQASPGLEPDNPGFRDRLPVDTIEDQGSGLVI